MKCACLWTTCNKPLNLSNVRRLDMTLPHCSYQYMQCKISFFYIKFCRYTWEKNGKPYDWQVYDDRISQQPGRGTLVITSPRDEDIGKFSQIFIVSNFCRNDELSSTMRKVDCLLFNRFSANR